MKTLRRQDIASWTVPSDACTIVRRETRSVVDVPTRRGFLGRTFAAATAFSLASLGVLPPARVAFADGYDIYTFTTQGPCAANGYASGHGCTPGCGPSAVCGGGLNGSCCSGGFHRSDGNAYNLRPNQCWSASWDGWLWRCNSSTRYRCHDGYTFVSVRQGYRKTVCKAIG